MFISLIWKYFANRLHNWGQYVSIPSSSQLVKYTGRRAQRARERQIAYETVRLLRQDVIKGYRKEGVDHYDNRQAVNKRYYDVVVKNDVGQVQPAWANPAKNVGF